MYNTHYNCETVEGSKCYKCAEDHEQLAEWLKELKAYKEGEECDDCISRKEAIKSMKDLRDNYARKGNVEYHPHIDFVLDILIGLPSVTPKIRTGKWHREFMKEQVPMSVMEDIKAEIKQIYNNTLDGYDWNYAKGRKDTCKKALEIIEKHISGKENE